MNNVQKAKLAFKAVKTALKVLFPVVFAIIFIATMFLQLLIWLLISNYNYCSLAFQRDCFAADQVYTDDPVTNDEILEFSEGTLNNDFQDGMWGRREAFVTGEIEGKSLDSITGESASDVDNPVNGISGETYDNGIPVLDYFNLTGEFEEEANESGEDEASEESDEGNNDSNEQNESSNDEENNEGNDEGNEDGEGSEDGDNGEESSDGTYHVTEFGDIDEEFLQGMENVLFHNYSNANRGGISNPFSVSRDRSITEEYVEIGKENGIDPRFLVAITMHETAYGTSALATNANNLGGVRCISSSGLLRAGVTQSEINSFNVSSGCTTSNFQTFNDKMGSVRYMGNFLRRLYIEEGLTTIGDIGAKYAPMEDTADVNNLNSHWAPVIANIMGRMDVNVGDSAIPGVGGLGNEVKRPDFEQFEQQLTYTGYIDGDEDDVYGEFSLDSIPIHVFNHRELLDSDILSERKRDAIQDGIHRHNLGSVADFIQGGAYFRPSEFDYRFSMRDFGTSRREVMEDIQEKDKDEIEDYFYDNFYMYVSVEEALMTEAEMHLRAAMQNDLNGTLGEDLVAYEVAYVLDEAQRRFELWSIETFYREMRNNGGTSPGEWLYELGYVDEVVEGEVLQMEVERLLFGRKSSETKALLNDAARDGVNYPLYAYGIGRAPEIDRVEDGLQEEVEEGLEELKEEKELDTNVLAALTVGSHLRDNAYDVFVEEYGWMSLNMGVDEESFRDYVEGERKRALETEEERLERMQDEAEEGFLVRTARFLRADKLAGAVGLEEAYITYLDDVSSFLGRLNPFEAMRQLHRARIDMSMRNNTFVRYAMYNNTRERMEIGAYARNMCIFLDSYNEEHCLHANGYVQDEAALSWAESGAIDKTKASLRLDFECVEVREEDSSEEGEGSSGDAEGEVEFIGSWFQQAADRVQDAINNVTTTLSTASRLLTGAYREDTPSPRNIYDAEEVLTGEDIPSEFTGDNVTRVPLPEGLTLEYLMEMRQNPSMNSSDTMRDAIETILDAVDEEGGVVFESSSDHSENVIAGTAKVTNEASPSEFEGGQKVKDIEFVDIDGNSLVTVTTEVGIPVCSGDEIMEVSESIRFDAYYESPWEIFALTANTNLSHGRLDEDDRYDAFKEDSLFLMDEMLNLDKLKDNDFREEAHEYFQRSGTKSSSSSGNSPGGSDGNAVGGEGGGDSLANPEIMHELDWVYPIPLSGSERLRISSGYGMRTHAGTTRMHRGLDLTGPGATLTSILAMADGTVTHRGFLPTAGHTVEIRHTTSVGSITTRYLHLASYSNIQVGDQVSAGQNLGQMGGSGGQGSVDYNAYPPHLHFEIRDGSDSRSPDVNPIKVMDLNNSNSHCTPSASNCRGLNGLGTG